MEPVQIIPPGTRVVFGHPMEVQATVVAAHIYGNGTVDYTVAWTTPDGRAQIEVDAFEVRADHHSPIGFMEPQNG